MKLYDSVNNVLARLDDYPSVSGERVWTRAEIELYLKDGHDAFCRRTRSVFDFFYAENLATCGNYVARWEEGYFDSGMIAQGLLNYSGGYWEQDYAEPGAIGPINLTQPWEDAYLSTTFVVSRGVVPEDNVAVERATHDFIDLDPEFSRWFEAHDRNYQTVSGDPTRFAMDRDGIGTMRMVPAGAAGATDVGIREIVKPLKAYWKLDESGGLRADSVGFADLTATNSPGSTAGQIGNAAIFIAASSQVLEGTSRVDIDGSLGVTLHYWIQVRSGSPTFARFFFNGTLSAATSHMYVDTANTDPLLQSAIITNDAGESTTAQLTLAAYDTWYFVAAKYDPDTKKISISVDGGAWTEATTALTSHPTINTGSVKIGGYAGAFSEATMDEVALWNKDLSDTELAAYLALARPKFDPPGNSQYGLLRNAASTDGLGTWSPVGTWGGLREIPEHFRMGGQYGIPRREFSDVDNTRVEYFRLGKDLSQYQYELPARFVKYVEHYAQSKALERDGPGQDLALSQHFMQRFEDGVNRMILRLGEHKRSRGGAIGSTGKKPGRPGLARLPYQYGKQIRRGY